MIEFASIQVDIPERTSYSGIPCGPSNRSLVILLLWHRCKTYDGSYLMILSTTLITRSVENLHV